MALPVVETFGPFLIPVAIFTIGVTGYGLLVVLSRRGLLPWGVPDETDRRRNE